jgi:hypothetical protein
MKEIKTANYKKFAEIFGELPVKDGVWDIDLLHKSLVEIATAQWMWDAEQAAWWMEKKYKTPIDPNIRDSVIQKAQKEIDKNKKDRKNELV